MGGGPGPRAPGPGPRAGGGGAGPGFPPGTLPGGGLCPSLLSGGSDPTRALLPPSHPDPRPARDPAALPLGGSAGLPLGPVSGGGLITSFTAFAPSLG